MAPQGSGLLKYAHTTGFILTGVCLLTCSFTYFLDLMITNSRAILFVGPTGTGKSVYVKDHLMNRLDKVQYIPLVINFSAQTSANQTQVTGCTH